MRRFLAALVLLCAGSLPITGETVEIFRDANGNPHIFAATPAGAAFGAGYAQAEDRSEALLRRLKDATPEDVAALPGEVRTMIEAYLEGVLRVQPDAAVTAGQTAALARRALAEFRGTALMLDRTRAASKSVIALLETQGDWTSGEAPYEMSLYISQGDIAIGGVAPLGVSFPVTGHSRRLAITWSPAAGGVETAWKLITSRSLDDVRAAFAGRMIPESLLAGEASGNLLGPAPRGYVLQPGRAPQAEAALHQLLAGQNAWSAGRVENLALSAEVYKAETWQARLAKADPGSRFTRMLTGWNRRATADSVPALAFYLFKMELGADAAAVEPPDSVSDNRIIAALRRAQDRLEAALPFGANWGTMFRIATADPRVSYSASGGTVTEAGMATPRALTFARRGSVYAASSGQAAVRVVDLANPLSAVSLRMPDRESRLKPAYFGNRREIERRSSSVKTLIF
jgi:hypothetical protein